MNLRNLKKVKSVAKDQLKSAPSRRYERKLYFPTSAKYDLEALVKTHPYGFKEIYYERQVNSIYYDTEDLSSYGENMGGNPNRAKVRIRWYGVDEQEMKNAKLEIKTKTGLVGYKITEDINHLEALEDPFLKFNISGTRPVLKVQYKRKYFLSFDKNFRMTIDSEITYKDINNTVEYMEPGCVIEIKYDKGVESTAAGVVNHLSQRVTRFSKFARGIEYLYR